MLVQSAEGCFFGFWGRSGRESRERAAPFLVVLGQVCIVSAGQGNAKFVGSEWHNVPLAVVDG